jgi:hypothetical protein
MTDLVQLAQIHMEPPSDRVSEIELVVTYGDKGTHFRIQLAHPVIAAQLTRELVAQELQDLGSALLRIADEPSAITGHNLDHT